MTLVSVCIPVFNGMPYVLEAIGSVLGQSHEDLELIVVDNDSTDGTTEAILDIEDPRIRIVRNPSNIGAIPNWNRAISEASGQYVKLLCADDLLYRDCLASQLEALQAPGRSRTSMAAGQRDIINSSGRILLRGRGLAGLKGDVSGADAIRSCVRHGTNIFGEGLAVLLRRETLTQVGEFQGTIPYFVDVDYWVRVLDVGDLVALPDVVGAFRVSGSSWSAQIAREQGLQGRRFVRSVAQQHPEITRSDVMLGLARTTVLSRLRRGAFWWARRRAG